MSSGPKSLWDYEVFARANFADGRATAEANVFYYDMRDAQRSEGIIVRTPSGLPAGFANLFNVPKREAMAREGQLSWMFSRSFSATAAIGLLKTKFVRGDEESAAFEDNEFDRSPHFTGSLAIDWKPTDRARLSAQVRHLIPTSPTRRNSLSFALERHECRCPRRISNRRRVDLRAGAKPLGRVQDAGSVHSSGRRS